MKKSDFSIKNMKKICSTIAKKNDLKHELRKHQKGSKFRRASFTICTYT